MNWSKSTNTREAKHLYFFHQFFLNAELTPEPFYFVRMITALSSALPPVIPPCLGPPVLLQPVFLLAHGTAAGDKVTQAFLLQKPKLTGRKNGRAT